MNKYTLSLLGAAVILGAVVGGYYYPKSTETTFIQAGAVSDTQATPKMQQIQCDPATTTYISGDNKYQYCSLTNNSATDRTIQSVDYFWTAANGTVSTSTTSRFGTFVATTTAASSGYGSNTNWLLNQTVATSTPAVYNASSTPGIVTSDSTKDFVRIWSAGSVLVYEGTATTSGSLWLKVTYLQQ